MVNRHHQGPMRNRCRRWGLPIAVMAAVVGLTAAGLAISNLTISHADDGILTDVQTAASLKTKLAVEQQRDAAQQAARGLPQPPKDPRRGSGTQPAVAPWPTGIFEQRQAPFSSALYRITNHWQGKIGDEFVTVYAGAKTADPTQGVVVVLTTSAIDLSDRTLQTGGLYLTAEKLGALKLVAAQGTRLTLVTPGGKNYVFDLANRGLAAQ